MNDWVYPNPVLRAPCPHCGERLEIAVDSSQDTPQEFVEDCWICCRPNICLVSKAADGSPTLTVRGLED